MKETNAKLSIYIVMDTKPDKHNLCKIYARFLLGKRKKEHFLKIRWPQGRFDRFTETLLPRFADDPDVDKHNNLITEIKTRINKMQVDSYVKNKHYTIEEYIQVIDKRDSLADFAMFMESAIKREYNKNIITHTTYTHHMSRLTNIREYFGQVIPFSQITSDKIQEYKAYHESIGKKRNTVTTYIKVLTKYLNQAKEKGLIQDNPCDRIKATYIKGDRIALTQEEVKTLYKTFTDQTLPHIEHEVLRRFLFSCLTGLRISDTHQITDQHIHADQIVITPVKTKRSGKTIKIPLPTIAARLIAGRKGKLFVPFADQSINRILKRIAIITGVNDQLSYHSARDTFGTVFIELGGDIKSLQDLMGHHSTRTTEIYLKMADKRKVQLMNNFDTLFTP